MPAHEMALTVGRVLIFYFMNAFGFRHERGFLSAHTWIKRHDEFQQIFPHFRHTTFWNRSLNLKRPSVPYNAVIVSFSISANPN